MKTITQETITGQVQSVQSQNQDGHACPPHYLVEFVIKTIREGETTWFNVTANPWEAWMLCAGDEVSLTGQLTSSTWQDPFEQEEVVTLEMNATSLKKLAA